jgi:hypothetical protein
MTESVDAIGLPDPPIPPFSSWYYMLLAHFSVTPRHLLHVCGRA